jgi:F0F1-type ATP synthase assembly protein I
MTSKDSPGNDPSPLAAFAMVGDVLLSIAIPTSVFALAGRWLDQRFDASPWFTAAGLLLSVIVVWILVTRKAEKLRKRLYPNERPDRR